MAETEQAFQEEEIATTKGLQVGKNEGLRNRKNTMWLGVSKGENGQSWVGGMGVESGHRRICRPW